MKIDRADQLVEAAFAQVCTLEFEVGSFVASVLALILTFLQNKVFIKHV